MISLLFLGMGITPLLWGVYVLKGPVNGWLIEPHGYGYAGVPMGLCLLLWSIALIPMIPDNWGIAIFFVGGAVWILGLFVPSRFIDPPWMHWLKQEHGKIMPLLRGELYGANIFEWNRRVRTREELALWVNEVRFKHGLPRK
jgi:hypothetical protein